MSTFSSLDVMVVIDLSGAKIKKADQNRRVDPLYWEREKIKELRPDKGRVKRGRWDSFYVVSGKERRSPLCGTVGAMAKKAGDGN